MAKRGKGFEAECFYGTIRRERDDEGNPIVYGRIKIGEGYIVANGKDQWDLGEKLDQLVIANLNIKVYDKNLASLN